MAEVYEKLFTLLDEKKRLVLPTEISARSVMLEYVKRRKRAISFSSVIAFDSFKKLLLKRDEGLAEIDSLTRLLFARNLIDEHSERLHYFIPSRKYPEINERMVYYIASALVSLEDDEALNPDLNKDVAFIKKEYDAFLEKAGCYESAYLSESFNELEDEYVLVFSLSSVEMEALYNALQGRRNITRFNPDDIPLGPLNLYKNEKAEIRNTFLLIVELMKKGVTLDQIAISTAGYERLRPYLEREGYLFSIPLSFMHSKSPLCYPAGKIFSLISEIYTSSYDLEALKKLFLNPSYPLRDRDAAERFILNAISMGITMRSDDNRYRAADVNGLYHDLEHYIDSINETADPDYLINQVKSLFQKLLRDEQFSSNREDESVFSFLMDALMRFSDKVKELRNLGLLKNTDRLFSLFLKHAESIIYVPREKTEGLRVYPLSEAVGIHIPYHFVMTLNEDEGRKIKKGAGYLSDYELLSERKKIDVTRNMLSSYKALSENIIYSSSINTYNGYSLPLTDFTEKRDASMLKDSIADEHNILKNKSRDYDLFPLQKRSYMMARDKALAIRGNKRDMAAELCIPWPDFNPSSWTFSSSQIDKYTKCPFLYAADKVFFLEREGSYRVSAYPALEIGHALHKVIELYFKNGKGAVPEKVDEYLSCVLSLWQKRLTLNRDGEEVPLSRSVIALSDEMMAYIYYAYRNGLIKIIESLNERDGTFILEVETRGKIADLHFKGYIDCVIDRGESVELIDFKSAKAPAKSRQFDIYTLLYEAESGKEVAKASYATIKDGKIKEFKKKGKSTIEGVVKDVAESIALGDFHAESSSMNCASCSAKGICRRRFFVR